MGKQNSGNLKKHPGITIRAAGKALVTALKAFWKEPPKGRFLNLREIFCLGSASLGVSFICNIVNAYVTIGYLPILYDLGQYGTLYATIIYIAACAAGLILTPIYGRWIQRTRTRIGRYKPYILFLAPVVSILAVAAVWSPQNISLNARILYVYLICVPTLLVWNLWNNTYNMFPGAFTPNQQERTDIWSPIGLVMGFAPTVMNVLKDVAAGLWGDVIAARVFGCASAVVGIVCIIGLIGVRERVFITETENQKEKVSTLQGLKMVFKNRPLIILTLALMFGSMKGCIDLVWQIVARVHYADNMADGAMIFGAVSMIVGFGATPNMILLPFLTRKFNNRTIMMFWQSLNTGAYLVLALIGFDNLGQGTTSAILITALRFVAAFNAMGSLQPLMLSEIGDYQQHLSGYRLEGFIQTFAYSAVLLVTQLCALIPAVIQGAVGFNPNDYEIVADAANVLSPEKIAIADHYFNIAIWISVISGALMFICLAFYNLDKKKHTEIVAELKQGAVNADTILSEESDVSFMANVKRDIAANKLALYTEKFGADSAEVRALKEHLDQNRK